jgi:hypothetical protein
VCCLEFQKPLVSGLLKIEKTGRFFKAQNTNFTDENWLTDGFDRLTVLFSTHNSNIECKIINRSIFPVFSKFIYFNFNRPGASTRGR